MSKSQAILAATIVFLLLVVAISNRTDKASQPCGDATPMTIQVVEIDNYHESGNTRITVVFDVDEEVVASIAANTSITVVMSDLSETRIWDGKVRLWQYDEDYLNSMY